MANLIQDVRGRTEAGSADYSVNGVTYWTDDQIQEQLDQHREDIYREPLCVEPVLVAAGTATYKDYYFKRPFAEERTDGTVIWRIEDAAGSVRGTADYSVNYAAQHIQFVNDTHGTALYLSYRTYDLDATAADIWRRKAAHVADRYDIETDNHNLKRSQLRTSYLAMANFYTSKGKPKFSRLKRVDVR
jgi:outer membrane protein assembly factor BamB